jgi:3-deoxy-D-arabino-heptulosonate 7-phosphate (DAHP) synthase
VHPRPEEAVCDGRQSLRLDEFDEYATRVRAAAAVAGNVLAETELVATVTG